MDETVPNITFNKNGVCKYCLVSDKIKNLKKKNISSINQIKNKILNSSKKIKYNCIAGVSGGGIAHFYFIFLRRN